MFIVSLQFTFKLNSTNTAKEDIHELWNRNIIKISITNVIVYTQFIFKMNSQNTIKEGVQGPWNRNMMKIFITSVLSLHNLHFN